MKFRLLIMLCLLPVIALGAGTGYRIVHPDGTVEFSDQVTPGGSEVPLNGVQGYVAPRPPPASAAAKQKAPEKPADPIDYQIQITSPTPEETIWAPEWKVPVTVSVAPPLGEGDQIAIAIDGEQRVTGRASSYTLEPVYRGTHQVSARVIDASGNTLAESGSVTFYIHKHSILFRRPQP